MTSIAFSLPGQPATDDSVLPRAWQRVCVARLHYHLSWSTRGRSPVLVGRRAQSLRNILEELCRERGIQLQALAITPTQVKLVVSLRPSQLAATVVRELKGRSALLLFRRCPDLRIALGGHLAWNDRYALATVSAGQLARLVDRMSLAGDEGVPA
ncbi:MAG: IS200/IS605 family transposase [Candidatus Eiseniibacteriota bacterium]